MFDWLGQLISDLFFWLAEQFIAIWDAFVAFLNAILDVILGWFNALLGVLFDWIKYWFFSFYDWVYDVYLGPFIDMARNYLNPDSYIGQYLQYLPDFLGGLNLFLPVSEFFVLLGVLSLYWATVFSIKVILKCIPTVY